MNRQPRDAGAILRLRLPLTRSSASRMRVVVSAYLAANGVPTKTAREVLLAADEAFINAFMHSGDVAGEVELRAEVGSSHVLVEIRDRGCGFDAGAVDVKSIPDPLLTHGRGLFLINCLMDEVEVRSRGAEVGTCVRMAKSFVRRPLRRAGSPG